MLQPIRELFKAEDHPEMLVGLASADDAAVYRLDDERALVTTTDFFPPVVDDPYSFGAIAAANAISDIYAMGAKPLYALNLVAFPDGLGLDHLREILRGGAEKTAEAGAIIAGGHSVTDKEPKYGLAVTGIVNPAAIKTKDKARPGDVLLLTKSLGTGLITTALKQGRAKREHVTLAVASMEALNDQAAEAADRAGVQAMTDVTGFGLLGHAHEMAHLSGVNLRITTGALPWLDGTIEYGRMGTFPGGMHNNRHYFSSWVEFSQSISLVEQDILWTPETSGGLLASVPRRGVDAFVRYFPNARLIGYVEQGDGHIIVEE